MTLTANAFPSMPAKTRVQTYPVFESAEALIDFLARASWHFAHVEDIELFVPLVPGLRCPDKPIIPVGFDPKVQSALEAYLPRVHFQPDQSSEEASTLLKQADVVLKWLEDNPGVNKDIKASGKPAYRVDPARVRQEGSFFIQCALDLLENKNHLLIESKRKFDVLVERLGHAPKAWVLATGPSVESYATRDYNDAVVIVCNSVVLNEDLMRVCKPSILVFADPIFHFGVSQYAGRFRDTVEQRLDETDMTIVVPFKYYPLVISKFPRHAHRIIGVPFEKQTRFNLDVRNEFKVKTTSNILTLLLLPLATTFSREIHITGCDGRPLDQDDYFWGHGASVQINDKMKNIQQVHPGFFDIDYNEYYFEHCHTLDNLVMQAEAQGCRFAHHGNSHIPALRDRMPERLRLPGAARTDRPEETQHIGEACILLEPDGIGVDGHYVRWHNNLIATLRARFRRIDVLCNRAQDPGLYDCPARPTFTSQTWFVARSEQAAKADFPKSSRYCGFVADIKEAIRELYSRLPAELSIYIYYGSVQILKAMQDLQADLLRDGCQLRAFVCLFHESVITDSTRNLPRLPPNARAILMQAAAQKDIYKVAAVTERLADHVLQKYDVVTEVFPNPPPGLSDTEAKSKMAKIPALPPAGGEQSEVLILVLSRPREEKGSEVIADFIRRLAESGVPAGHKYVFRGNGPDGLAPIPSVRFLGDEISDEAYWDILARADLMILPYLAPAFTFRTSGILVDALLSGTPTIVFADTWLADVVKDLGTGLAVRYRSPATIASAIKVMLDHRDLLRSRMETGRIHYLSKNSWRAAADFALIGTARRSLPSHGCETLPLETPPAAAIAPRKPVDRQALPARVDPAFKRGLVADFARFQYRIDPALVGTGDLEKTKAEIIAKIPFRSPIYLPTEKIPMQDQVAGLSRVHSLVQSGNFEASRHRFEALKGKLHSLGKERIFVIGNGPSLKRTDLSLLKGEITIGFNGIFLHESFTPTIYMVEDHLVAEDRIREIHAYDCPVKVFPSYLGYCIQPQDNTLYLNHRPRISYPVDTDFSSDAGNITYTGGTVTYTGLQLAASLGFKQIILIGVDASYQIHDVERSSSYGTGVLTSKTDDANHFDPSYFGKGYRWHDPNVNTMLQAYRKARNWGRANGVAVVNATLGGQLEVFPRVDFHDLFSRERVFPRLGVLDFTSVNQLCATGVVKQNLLAGWPKGAAIHASSPQEGRLVAFQTITHDLYAAGSDEKTVWAAFRSLVEFDPEVLYLRPTHDRVVMTTLQVVTAALLRRPWTMHYMDDWLEKAKAVHPANVASAYETIMRHLIGGAARVFSICQKMSDFLIEKYDLPEERVVVAHNYLPDSPPAARRPSRADGDPLVIRYSGGLEPDMGLASLIELAKKIEAFNALPGATPIRLEIYAREAAIAKHGANFATCPSTILLPQFSAYHQYLEALATSDINLICYNFDARSIDYVRYSLANKLPELLSAGVPFFAIGDSDIATIKVLKDAGYPLVADHPDYELASVLDFALAPAATALERYHAAISTLKDEFSDARNRFPFQHNLRQAAALPLGSLRETSLPLEELMLLAESSRPRIVGTRDFDSLVRLLLVDRAIIDEALALIRSHGLSWSIRTEFNYLKVECPDAPTLAAKDNTIKARALAFLVCSLGGETHNHPSVNDVVREWLMTYHSISKRSQKEIHASCV